MSVEFRGRNGWCIVNRKGWIVYSGFWTRGAASAFLCSLKRGCPLGYTDAKDGRW